MVRTSESFPGSEGLSVLLGGWTEELLATLQAVHYQAIAVSPLIVAWTSPDSMDDAQVYVAMKGEPQAVVKEPAGDANGDLKVDLADMATLSANWLVDCAATRRMRRAKRSDITR